MQELRGTRRLGGVGEDAAVEYVEALGWRVRERNWRCARGELDIIALDPETNTLVFCEVKCRSGLGYGDPLEAVTFAKQAKLRQLAGLYVAEHPFAGPLRIDAIGVLKRRGYAPQITHVRGAA